MSYIYSESVLASYVTYKQLCSNSNYRSPYQILGEFINYIISTEDIYNISVPELKKKIHDVFGFQLPIAVIKSAVKKNDNFERNPNSEDYKVNRQNLIIDEQFLQYKKEADERNNLLTERLYAYATDIGENKISRNDLVQALIAYLIDETNGGKYQEIISEFILKNSNDETIVNQLNTIREGSILYLGLNCNIIETGSITNDLTLFLDMEILFDIYGYNGEVYKNLAADFINLVKEANKSVRRINLRYFEATKKEITDFFLAANEIVKSGVYLKENVAMKAIVNGCKDSTDVTDKESDFFHTLQYSYGIILDERSEYYSTDDYEANLEGGFNYDSNCEDELKLLSNINKLRKNQLFYDYTKCGYLFVTDTWKIQDISNRITNDLMEKQSEEKGSICGLAISMNNLTNLLWYKLNRGFGATTYPNNINSVVKAKIVLSRYISQNVSIAYDKCKKEYSEGIITAEQMADRLLGLRDKASKPEDITIDNISDNLNFSQEYLDRYSEERELQKVQLEEKEQLIQQITLDKNSKIAEYEIILNKTQSELEQIQNVAEINRRNLNQKDEIINSQKNEIEEKDKLLEKYYAKEKRTQKIIRILKFIGIIIIKIVIISTIAYLTYRILKHFLKIDTATIISSTIEILGMLIAGIDSFKNTYKKVFKPEK